MPEQPPRRKLSAARVEQLQNELEEAGTRVEALTSVKKAIEAHLHEALASAKSWEAKAAVAEDATAAVTAALVSREADLATATEELAVLRRAHAQLVGEHEVLSIKYAQSKSSYDRQSIEILALRKELSQTQLRDSGGRALQEAYRVQTAEFLSEIHDLREKLAAMQSGDDIRPTATHSEITEAAITLAREQFESWADDPESQSSAAVALSALDEAARQVHKNRELCDLLQCMLTDPERLPSKSGEIAELLEVNGVNPALVEPLTQMLPLASHMIKTQGSESNIFGVDELISSAQLLSQINSTGMLTDSEAVAQSIITAVISGTSTPAHGASQNNFTSTLPSIESVELD